MPHRRRRYKLGTNKWVSESVENRQKINHRDETRLPEKRGSTADRAARGHRVNAELKDSLVTHANRKHLRPLECELRSASASSESIEAMALALHIRNVRVYFVRESIVKNKANGFYLYIGKRQSRRRKSETMCSKCSTRHCTCNVVR